VTVSRGDVERMAALARLRLGPEEAARLTGDLNSILEHVAELREVSVEGVEAEGAVDGAAPFRDPAAGPDPLHRPPAAFAPDWREGFFAVPRLPAVDGGTAGGDA
jgi:aspartyl-tRNA(Asn)/glutamyl-tRNA(Gln) amidotransferase subunit C